MASEETIIGNRAGVFDGHQHSENGIGKRLIDTGRPIEVEGGEFNFPEWVKSDKTIYTLSGKNYDVIRKIFDIIGASWDDKVTEIKSGDMIICIRSAFDNTERTYIGTLHEILSSINTSCGCKHMEGGATMINHETNEVGQTKKSDVSGIYYDITKVGSNKYFKIMHVQSRKPILNLTSSPVKGVKNIIKKSDEILGKINWDIPESELTVEHEKIIKELKNKIAIDPKLRRYVVKMYLGGTVTEPPTLNSDGGYDYKGKEENTAKKAGLITLPKKIAGTNCSNCIFFKNGFCDHEKVLLPVNSRMCCSYWNYTSIGTIISELPNADFFPDKKLKDKKYPVNNRGGYEYDGGALDRAKDADLITLPIKIVGTTCAIGNCKYADKHMFCIHPKVQLPVTDRMTCGYWDNEDVIRKWGVPVEHTFKDGGELPKELQGKRIVDNVGFGGIREHTTGTVNLEDLEVLQEGINTAKNTYKTDKSFKPSKSPITVGVDIRTGKKRLLDGYHRYINKEGKGEFRAYFIPMMGEDILRFESMELWNKYREGGNIAPNGRPSNLTPEQYKLVRTSAFIKWFGNWMDDSKNASKVVDENGEPLVVYHGSYHKFTHFERKRIGSKRGNKTYHNGGFYFSDSYLIAESYKYSGGRGLVKNIERLFKRYEIKYAFLNIKNPEIIEGEGRNWDRAELIYPLDKDDDTEKYFKNCKPSLIKAGLEKEEAKEFCENIKKENYTGEVYLETDNVARRVFDKGEKDGVIFRNIIDTADSLTSKEPSNIFVAFYANQIKLADGTNTTFDSNNSDIRYGKGGKVAEEYVITSYSNLKKILGEPSTENEKEKIGWHMAFDKNHIGAVWTEANKSITAIKKEKFHKWFIWTANPESDKRLKDALKLQVRDVDPIKQKQKEKEISEQRWIKKRTHINEMSNNIHKIKTNVARDLKSDDEKEFLTALVVAMMLATSERVGNEESLKDGHCGVTGFQKEQVEVIGDKVLLTYIGKSGVDHDKSFTDKRIAKALKKAIKNSPSEHVFETSDGFKIKCDKVTRYLKPFGITPKNIRGFNANAGIIKKLKYGGIPEEPKERKKLLNAAIKRTALEVGHGVSTLKKHYMIPELPDQYIMHGNIIDMKNLGYYQEAEESEQESTKNSKKHLYLSDGTKKDIPTWVPATSYFLNPHVIPDAVNKAAEALVDHANTNNLDITEVYASYPLKEVAFKDIVPMQDDMDAQKIEDYIKTINDDFTKPFMLEYQGKYYLSDGHHRSIALYLNNKPIMAHVYEVKEDDNILKMGGDTKMDYEKWKRENVTYRGMQEIGQENEAGAMLGAGLYSVPLSNKALAKEYGVVNFAVNARPKNPKIFKTLSDWQVWFYRELVTNYSKSKGKDRPDKRDFNANTTIEAEMQKLGYDGIEIKGREIVNFKPENVLYFQNENQLEEYFDRKIMINGGDTIMSFEEFSVELEKPKQEIIDDMKLAIDKLKLKYDKINNTSYYADELAKYFPLGRVGFESRRLTKLRDRDLERTIDNAVNSIQIQKDIDMFQNRLKLYSQGKIHVTGMKKIQPISKLNELIASGDKILKAGEMKGVKMTSEEVNNLKDIIANWKKQKRDKEKKHKSLYDQYVSQVSTKMETGGSLSPEQEKEAERLAKSFIAGLSENDLESLTEEVTKIVTTSIIDAEKELDKLVSKKEKIQTQRNELYQNEKSLSYGEEKNKSYETRLKISYELAVIESKIRNQENVVKALKNKGDLASFTDKKGQKHNNIPSFIKVNTDLISFEEETILTTVAPPYIPVISEETFRDKGYVFDAIRIAPDIYIMAVNGYTEDKKLDSEDEEESLLKNKETGYILVTLDQLALINDYYFTKEKALLYKQADERNKRTEESYDALTKEKRESFLNQKGFYHSVPASVKKKYTQAEYEALSLEEKEALYKPFKRAGIKRLSSKLQDDQMWRSFHYMYERFVDPEATEIKTSQLQEWVDKGIVTAEAAELTKKKSSANTVWGHPEVFAYWKSFRDMMKWKIKDIQVQRTEQSEVRKIALETSFGESNTNDELKADYGILVKRQDGSKILPAQIEQIRVAWERINKTYGNLIKNANDVNLKISHTGVKYVFASKNAGVFIPDMKTIAVSNKFGDNQFESIMAHEVGHWIDYSIGKLSGKRYLSDDFESSAGIVAITLRNNMNAMSTSDYINSTAECFARAMEQYFAIENFGENATLVYSYTALSEVRTYHAEDHYVSKDVYNNKLKPLIKKFLSDNKSYFKYTLE